MKRVLCTAALAAAVFITRAQTPNTVRDEGFTLDTSNLELISWSFQEFSLGRVYPLSDGKVMVVGSLHEIFYNASGIMRFDSDGVYDESFDAPDVDENVALRGRSFAELPNGQYLVGGIFTFGPLGGPITGLMKLNADGSQDETFGSDFTSYPTTQAIALQSDGKILIGGAYTSMDFGSSVTRLHPDGSMDDSFYSALIEACDVREIQLLPDGNIVVAGNFSSWPAADGEHATSGVAVLNPDGSVNTNFTHACSFGPLVFPSTYPRIAVQPDGKIIVAGLSPENHNVLEVLRYNSDFTIDDSFHVAVNSEQSGPYFCGLMLQADGKIILCGYFIGEYDGDESVSGIFRLNADGTLDSSFDTNDGFGDTGKVYHCALQNDGKILIYSFTTTYQEEALTMDNGFPSTQYIVRLTGDGIGPPTTMNEQRSANEIVAYPNPVSTVLTVDELPKSTELQIYGLCGRLIQTFAANSPMATIDMSAYTSGTYLLRAVSPKGIATRRVVVQ